MELSRRTLLKHYLASKVVVPSFKPGRFPKSGSIATSDLPDLSITEASALLRQKRLSPVELIEPILDRIDRVEGEVHAFATVVRNEGLQAARSAEKDIMSGEYRGPLHGIPVGVKDTH